MPNKDLTCHINNYTVANSYSFKLDINLIVNKYINALKTKFLKIKLNKIKI